MQSGVSAMQQTVGGIGCEQSKAGLHSARQAAASSGLSVV